MSMTSYLYLAVALVLIAVFLNYPPPELSPQLKAWKGSGQSFKFNGYNIFYKDAEGKGDGEDVVVILHGFPTCGYDFNKMWDGLTKNFGRIIMPDFLGYGLSDKPLDHYYSIFDKADMVEALLKKSGVSRVHILAHDMGDTVAQELVSRQNKLETSGSRTDKDLKIVSVCLLNGGILPETLQLRVLQKLLLTPYIGPLIPRFSNKFLFIKGLSEVFGEQTQATREEYLDHWALMRYNDGHLVTNLLIQYLPQRFANRDKWVSALIETSLPLHLIYGPSDPINPPDLFLTRYKKLIPHSGITELEAHINHYPQLEAPDAVLEAYVKFFQSVKAKNN